MSSRYTHHQHQQQHRIGISSIWLPMLCSRSDARHPLPKQRNKRSSNRVSSSFSSSSSRSVSDITPTHHHHHYSKLRKMFSSKSKSNSNSKIVVADNGSSAICRGSSGMISRSRGETIMVSIDLDHMDPPLPVINKPPQEDCLWKRRAAFKLQHIQVATA